MCPLFSPPAFLIILLGSLYAGIFHFFFGRGQRQLFVFWATSIIGFFIGDLLAAGIGFSLLHIGVVHIDLGTIASLFALVLVRFLRR